nr:MAG TPA: hypothetical protein [Crassvirales sp.]
MIWIFVLQVVIINFSVSLSHIFNYRLTHKPQCFLTNSHTT